MMAIWVQTRTFFILAALLGRFVTIKAQEEEEYDAGEFLFLPFFLLFSLYAACLVCTLVNKRNGKLLGYGSNEICGFIRRGSGCEACALGTCSEGRGDFKSWRFAEFPGLRAQSCGHRGGRTDGKQKAAAGQPAVSPSPAAWQEQHAALGSLQQKRAPRDGAGGGCGAGEQPELGEVNTEAPRVEPFCAERPLPSYLLCFRETPKCHFPFSPFLSWVLFLLLSLPFSVSFPAGPGCGGCV